MDSDAGHEPAAVVLEFGFFLFPFLVFLFLFLFYYCIHVCHVVVDGVKLVAKSVQLVVGFLVDGSYGADPKQQACVEQEGDYVTHLFPILSRNYVLRCALR
jgi:hypothetical protein